jgi:shikimate kinase
MVEKSTMIPNKAPHPNKRRAPEHAKASLTRNDETPTAQAAKKSTLTSMMEARGDKLYKRVTTTFINTQN